jgi:hypothetical protein
VIRADVLRDATGLAGDDVCLPDVVEERRLPMVDVPHDRHDRRTRRELRCILGLLGRIVARRVLLFPDRLEAVLPSDQLDLIKIEPLVDGHHHPQVLEREPHDLRRRQLENLRQLAHRDELIHAYGLLFALNLRLALGLELFARHAIERPSSRAPSRARAHGAHGPRDVRRHGLLIHGPALPLLATTASHLAAAHARAG